MVALATLTLTGGITYCTVESGDFSQTFDQSEYTGCCFKQNQNCLSEWYWNTPVNVTKLNLFTGNYYPDSSIIAIWGLVNGVWVEIWRGEWKPPTALWDSKAISCTNCTGIRISQKHAEQILRPCINEVSIDYEEVADTSCTAAFQETSAKVGDTIHADFTWANAEKNPDYFHYAAMNIKDPNGNVCGDTYFELIESSGSKALSCVTDIAGTWTCQIDVWQGAFYVTCTDTVTVSGIVDVTLDEALTCEECIGYNNHGPTVTKFDASQQQYLWCYLEWGPTSHDFYGEKIAFKWIHDGGILFEGSLDVTEHWYGVSWCINPPNWGYLTYVGTGYIEAYWQGTYLGKTNDYTIFGGIGGIGEESTFYEGPFPPETNQLLAAVYMQNLSIYDSRLIIAKFVEYPGKPNEVQLGETRRKIINGGESTDIDFYWDIPADVMSWPLGVKVWAYNEKEPSWGTLGTYIFNIRS